MELDWSPEEEAFRQEVRGFLAREVTAEVAGSMFVNTPARVAFVDKLAAKGWLGMGFPEQYGGSPNPFPLAQFILNTELERVNAPTVGKNVGTIANTILLAIDGSRPTDLAVDYAAGLAAAFHSGLLVVHAYPQTSDLLGYDDFGKLVSRRKSAGQKILDNVRPRLAERGIAFQEDLLEGPEAEAILSAAATQKAELIVMGTRGLGTIEGVLFGSVSRKVSQHAHCPVMLIR